ncbi:MAG: dihydropteroate synthase [Bryobacteraceae bacterium]|jgi:dihydropteroate synthase
MNRKIYYWKLRTTELQLGERTLIMGVLNVTPDSFSDGGRFTDPDRAYARAIGMEEEGADIIDLGAESTRPDSKRISADEEWQRLVPVLKRLRGKLGIPLSLDTYKSEIAERALEYGVEILNDPSGLTFDAELAKVAANGNTGLVLNHMRGLPETWSKLGPMPDVMGTIGKDLEATISRARHAGVEKNRIVVDPGLGFGKRKEQNSEILAHLGRLAALDYPVLVGPSRKSFLNHGAGSETAGTIVYATAAAVAVAILNGAHIVRVHDVKEMRTVAQVADEIVRAGIVVAKPEEEAGQRPAAARPRSQGPRFLGEERAIPTRPPLSKPAPAMPVKKEAPPPVVEERPAAVPVRRPPQDKPSKGWTPKPLVRAGSEDRSPRRDKPGGWKGDRPTRGPSQGKPAYRGSSQDRPSRGPAQGKPPYRGSSEGRPSRGDSPRPPFRGRENRPPSGPRGDRPNRPTKPPQGKPPGGRPPQGGPPRRPFRKRP